MRVPEVGVTVDLSHHRKASASWFRCCGQRLIVGHGRITAVLADQGPELAVGVRDSLPDCAYVDTGHTHGIQTLHYHASAVIVFVVVTPPCAAFIASPGCTVEPLVHAP